MTKLAQRMKEHNMSYRKLAALIKTRYPESKISKSTLQEMTLGIKPILPHHAEILSEMLNVSIEDLI